MTSDATLRLRREIDAAIEGRTIIDLFDANADEHPDRTAIHWKEGDAWKSLTWSQYRALVHEAAAGFRALGIGRDDFVAIQAGNRPEHVIADLGAVHAAATPVTLYSTLAPAQVQYVANHCAARVVVLENLEFMKRWESVRGGLEHLEYVVLMEGAENYPTEDWVLSWEDLLAKGREALASDGTLVRRAVEDLTPESLVTLIYTSGTTGTPKGVMITHRNAVWTLESMNRSMDLPANSRLVSYLPLAHIAERVATHYLGIYLAGEVWYCGEMTEVLEYVQRARPQIFFGVPRVWEKFNSRLRARFDENEKRDLIYKALDNAVAKIRAEQAGESPGLMTNLKAALFDKLVFSKVRTQLGMDEVELAVTAAAPINPELIVFFNAVGIPLFELYGMSENTGPAISNRPDQNRIGSVGFPLAGVELRLLDDGEILLRGGLVVGGYYKMDHETRVTFDAEGWLHTGDLGRLDGDGYLFIVGRKKEIIITAAGKNIAPTAIETLIQNHPLVAQVCVIGDQRRYLTALVALDPDETRTWAEGRGIESEDMAALAEHPAVIEEVERAVDEANQQVSRVEQIKRFTIVPDVWTPDSGEITPSLKLKRRVVYEKYADRIEQMYAEA